MCQPRGTLRVSGGVFDFVEDEPSNICNGYTAQQTRVRGPFTLTGSALHVTDQCGGGARDWNVGGSDAGVLKLSVIGGTGGGSGTGTAEDLIFQRQ